MTIKELKSEFKELLEFKNDYIVGDIEAYLDDKNQFIFKLGVLFDGKSFYVSNDIHNFFEDIKYLLSKRQLKYVYFHNLDFDILFFLKNISFYNVQIINSGNLMIVFKDTENGVIFRNSLTILPMSLKKVVRDFLKIKWTEWENQKSEVLELDDKTLLEYCKRDTILTFLSITKIKKFMLEKYEIKDFLTIPSLAIKIYQKHFLNYEFDFMSYKAHRFFKEGFYFGGHTEKFIEGKYFFNSIEYYDVNSLYPSVMLNLKLNYSKFKAVKPNIKELFKLVYKKQHFYMDCEIIINSEDARVIPIKKNNANFYPFGKIRCKISHITFKYLLRVRGFRLVKIHYLLTHNNNNQVRAFKDYVATHYKLRKEDKGNDVIYKLLLNSLYGKFGQKEDITEVYINPSEDFENFDRLVNLEGLNIMAVRQSEMKHKPRYLRKDISGLITEQARIKMAEYRYKIRKCGINTVYQDTDSLLLPTKLENYYQLKDLVNNKELGKLKRENKETLKGWIVGLKFYGLFNKSEVKQAQKGVKDIRLYDYKQISYYQIIRKAKENKFYFRKKEDKKIDLTYYPKNFFYNSRFTKVKTFFRYGKFGIDRVPYHIMDLKERLDKTP
jgi:hypothetical protein